jgi:hypothetical protein
MMSAVGRSFGNDCIGVTGCVTDELCDTGESTPVVEWLYVCKESGHQVFLRPDGQAEKNRGKAWRWFLSTFCFARRLEFSPEKRAISLSARVGRIQKRKRVSHLATPLFLIDAVKDITRPTVWLCEIGKLCNIEGVARRNWI